MKPTIRAFIHWLFIHEIYYRIIFQYCWIVKLFDEIIVKFDIWDKLPVIEISLQSGVFYLVFNWIYLSMSRYIQYLTNKVIFCNKYLLNAIAKSHYVLFTFLCNRSMKRQRFYRYLLAEWTLANAWFVLLEVAMIFIWNVMSRFLLNLSATPSLVSS